MDIESFLERWLREPRTSRDPQIAVPQGSRKPSGPSSTHRFPWYGQGMAEEKPSFLYKNVLLRCVKPYPTARNHVYTGKLLGYDGHFVTIDGIVLHFGHPTVDDPTGGLTRSGRSVRWVALQRIEYIRELPKGVDPFSPENIKVGSQGSLELTALTRPDLLPE